MARRYFSLFSLSVLHMGLLVASVIAAQFLPGMSDPIDRTTACYWTIEILPYVTCGEGVTVGWLGEIFFNLWLTPLYGVAFSVSILQSLFDGSVMDALRQTPGLILILFQVTLIVVFLWGGLKRVIRRVSYKA